MYRVPNVELRPIDVRRLEPLIGAERFNAVTEAAAALRELLGGARIVNVNSTANGGGVAEMLATLLGYVRGIGLEADWLVLDGDPEFFAVTKRVHNGLYGSPGDGGELGARERAVYERTLAGNLETVRREIRKGDVVIVHDPQPAGLIRSLVERGRPRRLALSRGVRRNKRVDGPCLGVPATLRRGSERARVLARVVRA